MSDVESRVSTLEEHARATDVKFEQYDAILDRIRIDAGETRERTAVLESRLTDIRAAVDSGFDRTTAHLNQQDSRMDAFVQAAADSQGRALSQWPMSAQIAVSGVSLVTAGVVGTLVAWGLGFVHP